MIPRGDPLKPQPGRRESGARSVRGPKLAEDVSLTPAAHSLDGHTGTLATAGRLAFTTLVQEGNGLPVHTAERSTQYQDLDTNKVYINSDGATTWVEIGTGAGSGYSTIQDEGAPLTQRTTVDFVGAGVTATDTGAKTQVSIPGGGTHASTHAESGSDDLVGQNINVRRLKIEDTDGTPTDDLILKVLDAILYVRNSADSATGDAVFRNFYMLSPDVSGVLLKCAGIGGLLQVRAGDDTEVGNVLVKTVSTDTVAELTAGNGVDVDGLLIKDGAHEQITGTGDLHTEYLKESDSGVKNAASGYAGLTAGTKLNLAQMQEVMAHVDLTDNPAASDTVVGHVELATIAETDTGTDATRAVTPDGLAGSNYGERTIGILVSDPNGDAITVGDSKAHAVIPSTMNGWNLVEVAAGVSTVSSSGIPTVQIHRSRRASATTRTLADMLSTKLTIDASEFESSDAAAAAVIDTANDDVNTGDQIHVDIDVAGTGVKGLFVVMTFRLP